MHDCGVSRLCLICQQVADPMQELARAARAQEDKEQERKAKRAELVREFMVAQIIHGDWEDYDVVLRCAVGLADTLITWESEQ